jgi:tetratricopeptide (TPR) repeat protein
LGVDHIVEGSVRRAGDQLRITAQLIRADDGFHLWSETYDRRTEDTFAVQDDIAEQVAEALNVVLDEAQRQSMRSVGVRNVDALVDYQKGADLYNRAHQEANQISLLRQANEFFETAIRAYPAFSDAYIQHSELFSQILINQAAGALDGEITQADIDSAPAMLQEDFEHGIRYARDESQKLAVELDSAFLLGKWRGLRSRSERALLTSGCETALWTHLTGAAFGNAALTRDAFRRNIVCDPLLSRGDVHLAQSMLLLGEWSKAEAFAAQKLQSNPNPWLIRSLAIALAMQGHFEEARTIIQQRTPDEDDRVLALAAVAAIEGDDSAAEKLESQFNEQFGPEDQNALILAAQRGQRNEANRLASQMDNRPFGYITLMQAIYNCLCGAPFDPESTPVFASMLEDSGLEWPPVSPVSFPLKDW